MNYVDFPPFPLPGAKGPDICAAVCFYLAIIDDLSFEQTRILSEHIQECADCAAEFHLLQNATRLVATLPESTPSARVDAAILAALANPNTARRASLQLHPEKRTDPHLAAFRLPRSLGRRGTGALALVAALLLLVLGATFLRGQLFPSNSATAFQLPSQLSWNGYVLHYTQTRADTQGHNYQVEVYQDLGTNQMHIESSMPGQFDVVVVTTPSTMLGKDMMNHVAQMGHGVASWAIDGSLFDLGHLRQNLATRHATYLGQATFQGQQVYQVRTNDGEVLLLNTAYLPVGALHNDTGLPLYDTFALMRSTQVSETMWDMNVPPDFRMGELPNKS